MRYMTSKTLRWLPVIGVVIFAVRGVAADTVDFDDLTLAPESYWNGPDPDGIDETGPYGGTIRVGSFQSGNVEFVNRYNLTYNSWGGFAYSNTTDTTTPGSENQYSAITGSGYGPDDDNYGIAYGYDDVLDPTDVDELAQLPYFELPEDAHIENAYITNTTYAVLSMLHGDQFAKQFGGVSGDDPDWFKLTAYGTDALGIPLTNSVEFCLADYRFGDNGLDYIVDEWTLVDLSPLADARCLYFNLTSSDVDPNWGMNTPAYFAIDNIKFAPMSEPGADFDSDGDVDGADFLVWQRGESPNPSSAEDLALWEDQFGTTNPPPLSAAIPEPSSFVLLLAAFACSLRVLRDGLETTVALDRQVSRRISDRRVLPSSRCCPIDNAPVGDTAANDDSYFQVNPYPPHPTVYQGERPMKRALLWVSLLLVLPSTTAWAGLYSGPTDTSHGTDPAIASDSPLFVEWANAIDPTLTYFAPRGSTEISDTTYNSLGDLDALEIAAGESPGFLTVTFPTGIRNGPGHDFAVFENGFVFPSDPHLFAELAYVDVSSNGVDFARFPSISTNNSWEDPLEVGQAFAGFDSTNIFNLAGKHAGGFGTQFDLADLLSDDLVLGGAVDLNNIQYVQLVDIPGNGSFLDSQGNSILDNWLTIETGGFDFRLPVEQGVGVMNAVPEPASLFLLASGAMSVYIFQRRRRRNAR